MNDVAELFERQHILLCCFDLFISHNGVQESASSCSVQRPIESSRIASEFCLYCALDISIRALCKPKSIGAQSKPSACPAGEHRLHIDVWKRWTSDTRKTGLPKKDFVEFVVTGHNFLKLKRRVRQILIQFLQVNALARCVDLRLSFQDIGIILFGIVNSLFKVKP